MAMTSRQSGGWPVRSDRLSPRCLAGTAILFLGLSAASAVQSEKVMPNARHPGAPTSSYDLGIELSPDEKDYLASLPPMKLGIDPAWAPFSFVNAGGQPDGISANYLQYIQQTLHVTLEMVPSQSWKDTLLKADNGGVDVIAAVTQNNALATPFLLTDTYTNYPVVIVTREDAPFVDGLSDLANKRVAVVDGADVTGPEVVSLQHIQRVPVASAELGLAAVARERAFAYIGNLAVTERIIRQRYAGHLRVVAPTGYSEELRFGVAPRFERLLPLINRTLRAIPPAEREYIENSWVSTHLDYGVPSHTLWRILSPIAVLLVGFIAILGFIIAHLRREVRQRRWTERELRFQTTFQQMMMNTMPIPVFVRDMDGCYVAINPAYETAMEVHATDLIGKDPEEAARVKTSDDNQLSEIAIRVTHTGEPAHGELQYTTKDGEVHDAVYWLTMCRTEDGSPRAVLGAMVDISRMRRMEQREVELKRQLLELTQAVPAVMFQLHYLKGSGFRPIFVTNYTKTLLGIEASDLLEHPHAALELLHEADRLRLVRLLLRSKRTRKSADIEIPLRRSEQEPAWVHFEAVPQCRPNGAVVWSGYLVDVTQTKRQTSALDQAKREAEEASRTKDVFLATMSHEIRTPMSGVIGLLELMSNCRLNEDSQHLLSMVRTAAQALMRILNDILDFSKAQTGEIDIASEPMDIRELVDRVAGIFTPDLHRKGLRFDVIVRANVAMAHLGDPHRIAQVLLNLLSNAAKFTESGGIQVVVGLQEDRPDGQTISFSVKDTGIGVPLDHQQRLFTPFMQADSSTSRRFGGTGLGLAICKRIVEAMHGTIELVSRPGEGTEVTASLSLPRATTAVPMGLRRDAWLVVGDSLARVALIEALAALNIHPISSGDLALNSSEPVLVFRDSNIASPITERPLIYIEASRDMMTRGGERTTDGYRLRTNPLGWDAIREACKVADETSLDKNAVDALALQEEKNRNHVPNGPLLEDDFPILLVEDQPLNQELLLRQMAALHVRCCDMVANGVEALDALDKRSYCLVITDCAMPVMDGVELMRRIREREAEAGTTNPIYLVALTANATAQQREACMTVGADEVLIKPVDTSQLFALLDRAQRRVSPSPANGETPWIAVPVGISPDEMPAFTAKLKASLLEDLSALDASLEHEKHTAIKQAVHRILGTARWFRLEQIAEAAQAIEVHIDANEPFSVAIDALRRAVLRATQQLP